MFFTVKLSALDWVEYRTLAPVYGSSRASIQRWLKRKFPEYAVVSIELA